MTVPTITVDLHSLKVVAIITTLSLFLLVERIKGEL